MSGRPIPDIEALLEGTRRSFRLSDIPRRMSDPDLFEISPDLEIRFEPVPSAFRCC